jgi:hypothetical protein
MKRTLPRAEGMTALARAEEAPTVRTTDAGTAEASEGGSAADRPVAGAVGPAVAGPAAGATVGAAGLGAGRFGGGAFGAAARGAADRGAADLGAALGCGRRITVLTPPGARSPGIRRTLWQVLHWTRRPANSSRDMIIWPHSQRKRMATEHLWRAKSHVRRRAHLLARRTDLTAGSLHFGSGRVFTGPRRPDLPEPSAAGPQKHSSPIVTASSRPQGPGRPRG